MPWPHDEKTAATVRPWHRDEDSARARWRRRGHHDPRDAILAAARLLRPNGAPGDMADALWHYNPSDHYVRAVTEYARTMQRSASIYRGYWHWRVLYRHARGTYVLPVGYPDRRQCS